MRSWMGLEELDDEQLYGAEKAKARLMKFN